MLYHVVHINTLHDDSSANMGEKVTLPTHPSCTIPAEPLGTRILAGVATRALASVRITDNKVERPKRRKGKSSHLCEHQVPGVLDGVGLKAVYRSIRHDQQLADQVEAGRNNTTKC